MGVVSAKTAPANPPNLKGVPLLEDGVVTNLQTAQGTAKDPMAHNQVGEGQDLTQNRAAVDRLLRWHWGAERYVKERPREGLRKWIEVDVEGGEDSAGKDILERLKVLKAKPVFLQALEYQRSYGGSAITILSGDADSAKEPLNMEALSEGSDRGLRGLRAVSRHQLQPNTSKLVEDVMDPDFGMPEAWDYQPPEGSTVTIHRSRILLWLGDYAGERPTSYEWGHSALEQFLTAWLDYLSVQGSGVGVAHRLAEQRQFVQGLFKLLSSGGLDKAKSVLQDYATARSAFRMSFLDANDKIEDANINLSGWKDLHEAAKEQVAAAAGMSITRFFGTSRAGLSDKDESGSERDDATIAEYQEQMIRPQLERLIELVAAELGIKEDSWTLRFRPLREETPKQRADRRKIESEADRAYKELGAVDPNEVRQKLRDDPDAPYPLEEGSLKPQDKKPLAM